MAISTSRLDEEVATLKELILRQQQRLDAMEHGSSAEGATGTQSRRNLLKLAGAGLVGAAGAAAFRVMPASAATGGAFLLGANNQADKTSALRLTAATPAGGTTANPSTLQVDSTNSLAQLNGNIRGIESIGLNFGAGVAGMSWNGPGGLFGSQLGPDIQLGGLTIPLASGSKTVNGTGRLAQMMISGVAGAGPSTTVAADNAEMVRGTDASLWLSTTGTSSTASANWKRMNTVRVDKADGTGSAFAPARIVDTRSPSGPTAGAPLAAGSTHTFGPFTGTNGIPADAVGLIGNLTVVNFTGAGYVTLFPGVPPTLARRASTLVVSSRIAAGRTASRSGWVPAPMPARFRCTSAPTGSAPTSSLT